MPHIGAVMERSLVEPQGFGEALRALVVRSVVAAMGQPATDKRGISDSITDVKTAFSSWDNCMQAVYCKWPVIAVIVIGGLIILGIVWCIARCVCCGLSCCCECCYCLKCCGECCGCCTPPNRKKYLDEPYIPPHHDQAYQPQAPMIAARTVPSSAPAYEGSIAKPEPPQYAEFDTSKKNADDLPAMPSWEGANSKKVLLEEEEVELEQLKKPEAAATLNAVGSTSGSVSPVSPSAASFAGATLQNNTNGGYRMPPSRSATDPYAANDYNSSNNNNGYGNAGGFTQSRDQLNQGYDQGYGNSGYGNQGQGYGGNQGYGNQGYGGAMRQEQNPYGNDYNAGGYGRGPMNQNQGPGYAQRAARSYDDYGRSVTPRSGPPRMGTPGNAGYGRPAPTASPAPYGAGAYGNPNRTMSPAPQQGGFGGAAAYGNVNRTQSPASAQGGYGYGQRTNTPNSYGRQYPPAPQRQYSTDVAAQPAESSEPVTQYATANTNAYDSENAQSPIQNSGGFDFTSGFSRPPTAGQSPSPPSPTAQQTTGGGAAYPGYRAYKPAQ